MDDRDSKQPKNTLLVDSSGYNCVVEGSVIGVEAWW